MPGKLRKGISAKAIREPKRNIRLTIAYDGTAYHGWQRQKNTSRTIQQIIEHTLAHVLQHKVSLIGSGRTDVGVHAQEQTANFKTNNEINLDKLQRALNSLLPLDIVIAEAKEVPLSFHCRYDAKSKFYRYTILNRTYSSPYYYRYSWLYKPNINVSLMRRESKYLLGRNDFRSFQAKDKIGRNSVRTIQRLIVTKKGDFIYIDICADGFLYNMARNIVGTLIDIASGKL
ncbi:MAG: tRNA pseudouridine(38-40) synthase TruA, partial [Candidatus Omnitrophica bacterium]|nr:tRNA pseudouridine(38-40) synthase TruA [Candidatus Omnitrophota bacterium]